MSHLNQALLVAAKQKEVSLWLSSIKRLAVTDRKDVRPFFTSAASTSHDPIAHDKNAVTVPSYPVQPLNQTLERYLKSIKPFGSASELEATARITKNFGAGLGTKLQKLLEDRATSNENWLADWWLKTAYLEYRAPVIIFSSPGLVWPKVSFKNQDEQLQYAAVVIASALDYYRIIEDDKLPQEMLAGKHPICMSQYYKIFGTCRIPKIPSDELVYLDPKNPSRNIVVMYNNHLFDLPVFEENSRKRLGVDQFYTMLLDVVRQGDEESGVPIGILTTEHRDNWAKAYELLKRDSTNKQNLENSVEKSLFTVCIDKPLSSGLDSEYGVKCSRLLLHGYGSKGNAGNRWYDKTIQFVIGAGTDGVGIAYEHSPAEGGPIGVLTDFVIEKTRHVNSVPQATRYPKPKKLPFVVSEEVQEAIRLAGQNLDKLSNDLEVCGWSFSDFGKNEIKKLKVSPDSFIQVAIQLAFFKVHNRPAAQYESGSLRKYIYGRTDIIRTCSEEVVEFCKTNQNKNSTIGEKCKALRDALDAHKNYANEVVNGRGVDRHLLGLKILAKANNLGSPEIFDDLYNRSTYFQLSTSNVPTACDGVMVYGPLVNDGYACCYNPRGDNINFGTSAWSSCPTTDLEKFRSSLRLALLEMRDCLMTGNIQSKL